MTVRPRHSETNQNVVSSEQAGAPLEKIAVQKLHVAIIMDGNGRWAKMRHLPRAIGHKAGVDALRKIVESVYDLDIGTLSVYAFSTENWRRPVDEIDSLFGLLRQFINADLEKLRKNGVRVRIQGRREGLSEDVLSLLDNAVEVTKENDKLTLVICLNYGGQAEIIDVTKAIAQDIKSGKIDISQIDSTLFEDYLSSKDWPMPDLIIRTAGEQRLSNFLMWQSAYSEFVFTDRLWPDFSPDDLQEALKEFAKRKRRYGGI